MSSGPSAFLVSRLDNNLWTTFSYKETRWDSLPKQRLEGHKDSPDTEWLKLFIKVLFNILAPCLDQDAMISPLFSIFSLEWFNYLPKLFWFMGISLENTLTLDSLTLLQPYFKAAWILNGHQCVHYGVLFLINWTISLVSQGKFLLSGSTDHGIHSSITSKKVVSKCDHLVWMSMGSSRSLA